FASSKRALPTITVVMLGISAFLRGWGWLLLLLGVCGVVICIAMLRNPVLRERFDAAWLTLPLVGRLSRGYNAARFAGTLSMLAGRGVPTPHAACGARLTPLRTGAL